MSAQIMGGHDDLAFAESPSTRNGTVSITVDGLCWEKCISNIGGLMICAKEFAEIMAAQGVRIGNGENFPVKIEYVEGKARKSKAPEYCWLRPLRELAVEKLSINDELVTIPVSANLPASHIFGAKDTTAVIYCNLEFLLMARANKWDCFEFTPMGVAKRVRLDWVIDHLGDKWPPQWLPDGVELHPSNLSSDPLINEAQNSRPTNLPRTDSGKPLNEDEFEGLAALMGLTPTDYRMLGETVYWNNSDGVPDAHVERVKIALNPYLESALLTAEAKLLEMAAKTGMEPEIEQISIDIAASGPVEKWTLNIEGYIDGPCPYYGLDFEGDQLLDISGAD